MFYDVSDLYLDDITLRLTKMCNGQAETFRLPAYYFDICIQDGTIVGKCRLLVGNNEESYFFGNISVYIDDKFHGHRYGVKACQLLFKQAKKHGMDYLIIACPSDSAGALRTCESLGGQFIESRLIPDNVIDPVGEQKVNIYKVNL